MKIIDLLHTKRNEKVMEGTFPYLEISDIDVNSKKYSFKDKTSVLGAVYAHKNNILVSTVRPTRGAITIVKEDEIPVSNAFAILNVNDKICLPKYLFYSINNKVFFDYLGKNSKGATYPTCSKEDIYNYHINYMDHSRQNEIVTIFDNISRQIEIKTNQLSDYDQLIKSRFVEMFGDPVKNSVGWKLSKLEDVGNLKSGGTPSRSKPDYFTGTINWYSAGELNSLYPPESLEKITQKAIDDSSAKIFNKNTLLLGMYDTAAFKMGILVENSSSNQACCNIEVNESTDVVWLYFILNQMKEHFLSNRRGIRQKNLNLGMIKKFEIPLPPIKLQKQFAEFAQKVYKLKFVVQKSLDETQKLFDSLMQEYFG